MAPLVAVSAEANAAVPCAGTAADVAAATAMAKSCDKRVEAVSSRTETSQTFLNSNGTSTIEQFSYPQRVRRSNGSWSALDPTLVVNLDGSLSPRASTADVVFSGGGTSQLVTARSAGRHASLSWPAALPKPVVSGASATYPEVLPGVDLVVTATGTGFGEVFVVKNRAAASNPAVRQLVFGSTLAGLRWQDEKGQLKAVDESGKAVLSSSAPRMWDASSPPGGHRPEAGGRSKGNVSGPADGARTAEIQVDVVADRVTLAPDQNMLDDPSVVFPLYLDPTLESPAWTMINQGAAEQEYWTYDREDCPKPVVGQCAKVGRVYEGSMVYRSMFQFPTSEFRGTQVLDSLFTIDLLYSAYSGASTTELRTVNAEINSGTNWNNNAANWGGVVASVSNSMKPVGKLLSEFGGSLTAHLQAVANSSAQTTTWGLMSNNESSDSGWKKFNAATAKLVVTVNHPPNAPDQLTVDGRACASGTNRPVIATATPVLKSRVTDPNGNAMTDYFGWQKWNGSSWLGVVTSYQVGVPSGGYGQVTTGTLEHAGIYTFNNQATDPYNSSSPLVGGCEWEVDLVNPNLPAVTSATYVENCEPCGSVGQTGHFSFTSSTDVTAFRWGVTSPPTNVVSAPGGVGQLDWTSTVGGGQFLYVQAVDRAGRASPIKNYQFSVAAAAPMAASWPLNDPVGSATVVDETGNGFDALVTGGQLGVPGRVVPGPDGFSRSSMRFTGPSSYISAPAVLDTATSYAVAAWVKLDNTSANHPVVVAYGTSNRRAFSLAYTAARNRWTFDVTSADSASSPTATAASDAAPAVGVWTHLAGVYDAGGKNITLYVDGVRQGSRPTAVITWNATAGITIGKSPAGESMAGSISDVRLWNRTLSAAEAVGLSDRYKVADYQMESVGRGPETDLSDLARDLYFHNGVTVPGTDSGHTGTGLRLDGVDDYASPDAQVLYTDQSFTVSAWVRLTDKSLSRTIISQPGTGSSPFSLQYNATYDRWVMNTGSQDVNPVWSNAARSTSVPALNTWTRVTGVYDAARREARLYVNDVLEGTSSAVTMWSSAGWLEIGKGFAGYIDEIQVYQGITTVGVPRTIAGDVNGDGRSDLVIAYDVGGQQTKMMNGLSDGSKLPNGLETWFDSGPGNFAWANSQVGYGDFDGDGLSDVGVLYNYGNGSTSFFVFRSTGTSFEHFASFFHSSALWWENSKLALGDYNGDGKTDLGLLYNDGSGASRFLVSMSNGTSMASQLSVFFQAGLNGLWPENCKLAPGDYNGDGKTDLGLFYLYPSSTSFFVLFSNGTSFGGLTSLYNFGVGGLDWFRMKVAPGDYNGDGKTDIGMLYNHGSDRVTFFVGLSNGTALPNGFTPFYASNVNGLCWDCTKVAAGDFNGDGLSDVGFIYSYANNSITALFMLSDGASMPGWSVFMNAPPGIEWNRAKVAPEFQ